MNVLSLFDGMSCGQIALERAGIRVDHYFASEIDKHAIKVTMANYPNTVQLGDVTSVRGADLPKIDLLIGGSPCQGFSFAGKQLNFEDPRSKLFFEYVRILNEVREINPKVKFLLENVKMKKEYQDVISGYLGVQPIEINSALVSAQNRVRLYWTNIAGIEQPFDKYIYLKDIVESAKCTFLTPRGNNKGGIRSMYGKVGAITGSSWENNTFVVVVVVKKDKPLFPKKNQIKAATITAGAHSCGNHSQSDILIFDGAEIVLTKSGRIDLVNSRYARRFTPVEFERLQTVPDNFTNHVSNSQRYKMLGNGWTVDVIAHIFSFLNKSNFLTDCTGIMPPDAV